MNNTRHHEMVSEERPWNRLRHQSYLKNNSVLNVTGIPNIDWRRL
jgi:hypothetical protein